MCQVLEYYQQYKGSCKITAPVSHQKVERAAFASADGVQGETDYIGSRSQSPPSTPWSSLPSSSSLYSVA